MKKNILITTLFFLSILPSFSQTTSSKLNYGIKAGVNASFMNLGDIDREVFSSDVMIGFSGGFKVAYDFIPLIGISGELLVSTQNYSMKFIAGYSVAGEKWIGDLKYYTTNLSVPILLRFNVSELFTIEAGAQYSYKLFVRDLLDCQYMHILITYPHYNYSEFTSKVFNRSDVAAIIGASFKFNRFGLNFRYTHGFIPAVKTVKFNTSPPNNAINVMESIDRDFNPLMQSLHVCFEYLF
ncbi:PorT family protein [Bacteroidales bacterium OttesenSCG-928-K22]|nr:PorT family protein [Bacteroidales bacterium OttesenSCG-928-K22]